MHIGKGRVIEMILEDNTRYAHLTCSENLIPGPGQYLLANGGPDSLLPFPIFYTDSAPQGFIGPAPELWNLGQELWLRGPIGHGFSLPVSARKVGLVAYDGTSARLRALIRFALKQNASIVLLCDSNADHLPDEVEIQPLSSLEEMLPWADYVALDVEREGLPGLRERLGEWKQVPALRTAQILIRTPMPCGGIAECSVCALPTKSNWQMVCKDGPVFDLRDL